MEQHHQQEESHSHDVGENGQLNVCYHLLLLSRGEKERGTNTHRKSNTKVVQQSVNSPLSSARVSTDDVLLLETTRCASNRITREICLSVVANGDAGGAGDGGGLCKLTARGRGRRGSRAVCRGPEGTALPLAASERHPLTAKGNISSQQLRLLYTSLSLSLSVCLSLN